MDPSEKEQKGEGMIVAEKSGQNTEQDSTIEVKRPESVAAQSDGVLSHSEMPTTSTAGEAPTTTDLPCRNDATAIEIDSCMTHQEKDDLSTVSGTCTNSNEQKSETEAACELIQRSTEVGISAGDESDHVRKDESCFTTPDAQLRTETLASMPSGCEMVGEKRHRDTAEDEAEAHSPKVEASVSANKASSVKMDDLAEDLRVAAVCAEMELSFISAESTQRRQSPIIRKAAVNASKNLLEREGKGMDDSEDETDSSDEDSSDSDEEELNEKIKDGLVVRESEGESEDAIQRSECLDKNAGELEKESVTLKKKQFKQAAKAIKAMEEDGDEDPAEPPRTAHEVLEHKIPKIDFEITELHDLEAIGSILCINKVDRVVVIKGSSGVLAPVDMGSPLCLKLRTPLGLVDEVFGPVLSPLYSVRFETVEEIPADATPGATVFCVRNFSSYVIKEDLLKHKGCDASNVYDEEVPVEEQEFSDDEQEAVVKSRKKAARKRERRQQSTSQSGGHHHQAEDSPELGKCNGNTQAASRCSRGGRRRHRASQGNVLLHSQSSSLSALSGADRNDVAANYASAQQYYSPNVGVDGAGARVAQAYPYYAAYSHQAQHLPPPPYQQQQYYYHQMGYQQVPHHQHQRGGRPSTKISAGFGTGLETGSTGAPANDSWRASPSQASYSAQGTWTHNGSPFSHPSQYQRRG